MHCQPPERLHAAAPRTSHLKTEMDILLGGIPRSGTTALARAIELHPDIFCWSGETGLLPLLDELTRGLPMRADNLVGVTKMICRHLKSVLIDQREWIAAKDHVAPPVRINVEAVEHLASQVAAVLQSQLSRAQTLKNCTGILRTFLNQYNNRLLLAEKSPSNVLLIDGSLTLARRWLITHREPFAVIASMLERTKSDPWAGIMGGEIEQRIGLYIRHARSVISAKASPSEAMLLGYDSLITDPCGSLANVCSFLRVEPTLSYLDQVRCIIGGKPATDKWKQLAPLDCWKVLRLCSREMQALDYDERYYRASFDHMISGLPKTLEPQMVSLYGSFDPTQSDPMRWVQRKASFAVYAPQGVNALRLRIHNNVSAIIESSHLPGVAPEEWHVTAYCDTGTGSPVPLSSLSLAVDFLGDWQIDLRDIEPLGHYGNWRLFKINLEANFAFIPCFMFANASDERPFSFGLVDWRFDK
jgi:hypothetical protein